ncbi:MAG: hypothetical protein R3F49_15010 [Planctomycetota bacterium]
MTRPTADRRALPATPKMRHLAALAGWVAAACLGGLAGCSDEPLAAPAGPEYPAGTVLAIEGVPIGAEEVDRWAQVTAVLEPDKVQRHWRRLALSNVVLPMRAAEALDPEGRQGAFAEATRLRGLASELDRLPDDAKLRDVATGSWSQIGLIDWETARELEVGAWSPVYETPGGWAFFRVLEKPAEWGPIAPVTIERAHVFYLDPEGLRTLVADALHKLTIDIVDPEWEPLVPPIYLQHSTRRP